MGGIFVKKFFLFLALSCVIAIGAFEAYNLSKDKVKLDLSEGYEYDIKAKGLKGANGITVDEQGNIIIAFKDEVKVVRTDGREDVVFKKDGLNIFSIIYNKNKLFYISDNTLFQYDLLSGEEKELISNIPNEGDYKESKLLIVDDKIYISIGAATNSGVADEENQVYDISPVKITLRGKNFEKDKTGAFVPYGTKNFNGQTIKSNFPGNASIITYDISSNKSELFAWGIRNVESLDVDSKGELFAIVGGMEPRGLRPIKGDVDYIYDVKKGGWYGWPDFSGGDPVTSPRFNEGKGEKTTFILDKHPTSNPDAPFYQSNNLSSLKAMIIDKQGDFVEIDSIIFFDREEKKIFTLSNNKILNSLINIKGSGEIIDIEKYDNSIMLLEKNEGIIYGVYKENKLVNTFSKKLLISIISILLVFIVTIIIKIKITKEVK